jgi:basic membrane protein A
MKKFIALLAVLAMVFALVACAAPTSETKGVKIGVILVHDENTGYDAAHIEGIKAGAEAAGISADDIVWKYNIPEDETCYDTAIDLVEQGCTHIFSDSYGHQSHMQQAASENPDVTFVSMTGDSAALSGLKNFKNAFTHTFESRYVSGVVAGMKLKELMDAGSVTDPYIGYVGAYPYAEVVSGYTAFFLGIQSIVPTAHMDVIYTNQWYDPTAEAEAANALMAKGAHIIGQHADSTGAPSAVQTALDAGSVVYCVGYNIDMLKAAPTAALTSAQNNWGVYYTYAFKAAKAGEDIMTDWSEGYATGANMISTLGPSCAAGTAEKVAEVEAAIKDGTLNVFDCSTFTVGGEHPTSYLAIDTDGDWVNDTGEAIENGIFYESKLRSAPYFGMRIDGITELS